MMTLTISTYRHNARAISKITHAYSQRRSRNEHIHLEACKVDIIWHRVTGKKNSNKIETEKSLADKALPLIFGEKKYRDFSPTEKEIVDLYQEKKFEEDGVILPNTAADLEQTELETILRNRLQPMSE